jgi:hypothetical protein
VAARLQLERGEHESRASSATAARSSLAQLELRIAEARAAAPLPNVTLAEVDLARAENALAAAQDEYKKHSTGLGNHKRSAMHWLGRSSAQNGASGRPGHSSPPRRTPPEHTP